MEPIKVRHWRLKTPDEARISLMAEQLSIPPLAARLLACRGIETVDQGRKFLSGSLADCYDPFLLSGMAQAVERLVTAWRDVEMVCVYGDYDVDGITATSLLIDFFRTVGIACFYHIPNRMEDGYGLAEAGIRTSAAAGARIIVSVDCGITAVAEAELCLSLGIALIITDHHTPGAIIPRAYAAINPHQPGCSFPFKPIAGVGVAFNLMIALRSRLREAGAFSGEGPNLRQYLDLVALGTVADVVPLSDINRLFVTVGLKELTAGHRPGIVALKKVAGVSGEVSSFDVGFRLAPRLNACGRLEDATRGVELLLSRTPAEAQALAEELDARNAERQQVEQEILQDACDKLNEVPEECAGIVLASEEWHPGVIGIVASRIVELYHRPTVLVALHDGAGRGSGRSIPGFHLYDALVACSGHLTRFGGHKYAAGLSVAQECLMSFSGEFASVAAAALTEDDLVPEILIDAELTADEVDITLVELLRRLEPFGAGNPSPLFLLREVGVVEQRILKEKHLKLKLRLSNGPVDAIAFNRGDFAVGTKVDIVFTPEINLWKGRNFLQLKIRDIRNCEGRNI